MNDDYERALIGLSITELYYNSLCLGYSFSLFWMLHWGRFSFTGPNCGCCRHPMIGHDL